MPIISQLMEGRNPGEIKVYSGAHRFIPYFESYGMWHGLDACGNPTAFLDSCTSWKIYTEPKPKVKRAQYLLMFLDDPRPFVTGRLFVDDKDVCDAYDIKKYRVLERLLETEREFDE